MDDHGKRRGVTVPDPYSRAAGPWTGGPYPRAPRLGPRAFSISLVNSFGGNFVGRLHFYSRTNFKINPGAAIAEWRQLLSA